MSTNQPAGDRPILRLTGAAQSERPRAADAPFLATRLGVLTHELASLLDGSMRCLGMVRRSMGAGATPQGQANTDAQLGTIQDALERMATLVHGAMHGTGSMMGGHSSTLGDAVEHAKSVLTPLAADHKVSITSEIEPDVQGATAGALYTVMLNAVRNAIESIASGGKPGTVHIDVRTASDDPQSCELTVTDDGPGIAPGCDQGRAFIVGMTTKPGGHGIGLCLAAQIIGQLGGRINLTGTAPAAGNGAVFTARWPVAHTDASIG